MKRLVKKLRSNGGASLLFAMVVFALCALAGAVMLTSASANAGRYTHLEAEQRQYLSVASALDLLQAQLDDPANAVQVKVTYTVTETWYYEDTGGGPELQSNKEGKLEVTEPDLTAGETLGFYETLMLLDPACVPAEWYDGPPTPAGDSYQRPVAPAGADTEKKYIIELDEASKSATGAGYLYPVTAEFTAKMADPTGGTVTQEDYSLTLVLSAKRDPDDPTSEEYYPIQVVWTGSAETTYGAAKVTTTGTPGGDGGTRTTEIELTCTLKWSEENRAITFEE